MSTRLSGEDVHLQHVAGVCVLDKHRAADGVDEREVEIGYRLAR